MEPLQNKNAETVGHQARRAGATGGDGNFVVTTDLGNEFATLGRELPEAVRRTRRHCRGGPGHPDAEEGPGHEGGAQGRAVERPLRAGGRGLQRAAPRDGARRARGRGEAAGHSSGSCKTTPTSSSTYGPARKGGGGRGRLPSADERGEELQPSVRRRAAAGGRRETLLKLALPAPQGSGNAAGRLTRRGRPAAVRQLDNFLALVSEDA